MVAVTVRPARETTFLRDTDMRLKHQWWSVLVAVVLGGLVGVTSVGAAGEQFIPVLSIREGTTRSLQIPLADGYIAYLTLLNERDGGINGVKLVWEECETVFDVERGVACYERLKGQGPTGSGGVSTVHHADYLCPDRAGHTRPDPPHHRGHGSLGRLGWARVSVCFQPPAQLLESEYRQDPVPWPTSRGHGVAQGPENRPCLHRFRLWPGNSPYPRRPGRPVRLCDTAPGSANAGD
jgi:hypothetical protein